ncbi:hypothetical protein C8J56DRAFT_1104903 [Mycena floridula]|nr:hypothetical protein C8J56DRAFT_1104903 [Mycena floridula]
MDDDRLIDLMTMGMHPALLDEVLEKNIVETDIDKWTAAVHKADSALRRKLSLFEMSMSKRFASVQANSYHSSSSYNNSALASHNNQQSLSRRGSFSMPQNQSQSNNNNCSTSSSGRSSAPSGPSSSSVAAVTGAGHVGPLEDDQREIFRAHRGCYKCRRVYAGHVSADCPNGFPDPRTYVLWTAQTAQAACPGVQRSNAMAAVIIANITDDDSEDQLDSGSDGEASDDETVAAVFPPVDDSGESVSGPVCVPHMFQKCQVAGPKSRVPVVVRGLIDDGVHLVLIRPKLVAQLGLLIKKLKEPELVDVAIKDGVKSMRDTRMPSVKETSVKTACQWWAVYYRFRKILRGRGLKVYDMGRERERLQRLSVQ